MKKKIAIILMCVLSLGYLNFYGCTSVDKQKELVEGKKLFFDDERAKKIAASYMGFLYNKDFKSASELCTQELATETKTFNSSGIDILSFKLDETIQKGSSVTYKYKVSRSNASQPKTDLDNYYIKVDKAGGAYQISEVKGSTEIEGFIDKQKLVIRNKDEVNVKPVIDLSKLPTEMYPKNSKADIIKIEIPKQQFGTMSFSFEGNKIAFSSIGGNKTYVAIVDISGSEGATAIATGAVNKSGKGEPSDEKNEVKFIGKKIDSLDVYNGAQVTKLIFTEQNNNLIVTYTEKGISRFKIYKENGEILQTKLDDIFPIAQYNIIYGDNKEDFITFEVKAIKGAKDIKKDAIGQYKLSLKDTKLTKL